MKIFDFDAKFYDYVRVQMAMQPALKEDEIEEKYNQMMTSWLNAPAQWLDGVKPVDYFKRYSAPKDLIKLFNEYMARDIGLPEPLYTRIVEIGQAEEQLPAALTRMAGDADKPEKLRATAIALLRDMGSRQPVELFIDMICRCTEMDELSEMACDSLRDMDIDLSDRLLARYEDAPAYAKIMILDVVAHGPGRAKVYDLLVDALRRDDGHRGLYAGLLAEVGDERAIEPLREAERLSDLNYLDYLEIRGAIEMLGGEPGEPRTFDGDPAYEAMRSL